MVRRAEGTLVEEILSFLPAALDEQREEHIGVMEVPRAFGCAHVEPDRERRLGYGLPDKAKDAAAVPPQGGRDDGDLAKDAAVLEGKEEGDKAAERGSAKCGVGSGGGGAELAVNKRLKLFDEQRAIERSLAAAEAGVRGGGVLGHALEAGIGDADEDHRLNRTGLCQPIGGAVSAPSVAREVGGVPVEEVLTVVQVEDGKRALRLGEVSSGKIDGDGAAAGKSG